MQYIQENKKEENMDNTLSNIEKFHGHLGPYAVIGYKMGIIANENLGDDPFIKNAKVWTGCNPPISCIIDGIQLSSGCTLGKGNIEVIDENTPKAVFTNKNGKNIIIQLNEEIRNEIDSEVNKDNIEDYSQYIYKKSNSELFTIIY